jgi:hypothetical protein
MTIKLLIKNLDAPNRERALRVTREGIVVSTFLTILKPGEETEQFIWAGDSALQIVEVAHPDSIPAENHDYAVSG